VISFLAVYSTRIENAGIFEFIDSTPVIFIVFGLIVLLALWVFDTIISLINRVFNVRSRFVFHLIFLAIAIVVFGSLKVRGWTPASELSGYIKVITVILPLFFLVRYLSQRYFQKRSFQDAELFKFVFIIIGGTILLFIGSEVAYLVDQAMLEDVIRKPNRWEPKFIFLGFLFAFALGNLLNNIRKHVQQLQRSEKTLDQTKANAQRSKAALDALQASINPHFLYNALNAIAGLAKKDAEKTEQMALSLSAFYRYVTNKDQNHITTVDEEIKMINNYLKIEKIRFGETFVVELHCEDDARECTLPHFILQPIVENAIKYGFDGHAVSVKIDISTKEDMLLIRVFDSGKPFDENMSTGYGLKSVTEKLRLLYPDQHQFSFMDEPDKHVLISINQNK
jgi:sensor histidine kinase YesM